MRKSPTLKRRRKRKKDENPPSIGLSDKEVRGFAQATLAEHLPLGLDGKRYGEAEIFDIVLWASAQSTSIDDACQQLAEAPSANTVRNAINNELSTNLEKLESQLNDALVCQLPPRIVGFCHKVAMDLVFIPYHGQAHQNKDEIKRSVARSGTTHFHCYSTAYIIKNNKRVTLALTYVRATDSLVEVLKRILKRLDEISIRFRRLLLDKGFYTVAVISFLQERNLPFVIPVVHRGRSGGSRGLCSGKGGYRSCYTMSNSKQEVTFDVLVLKKYSKGRYGRKGVIWFVYAVNLWTAEISAVFGEYRQRFGIESSYRLMNTCRARTSSRNPGLRLFLVGIAFVLINIWIFLCWLRVSRPRRGGRQLEKSKFRQRRFLNFLVSVISEIYHLIREI